MTPRNQHEGTITWDGIENMIRTYDQTVIIPRQEELEEKVAKHEKTLSEWMGSLRVILWVITGLLVPILFGVGALVLDLLRWGVNNHWNYIIAPK